MQTEAKQYQNLTQRCSKVKAKFEQVETEPDRAKALCKMGAMQCQNPTPRRHNLNTTFQLVESTPHLAQVRFFPVDSAY